MKVYVSKKNMEENDLNFIEDEFVEKYWLLRGDNEDDGGFEVHGDVGLVEIETLEQHDAEIRKQAYAEGYQQGKFDTLADLESDEHFNRLAEYENLGTVEDFKKLKERQIIIIRGRESGKLVTEKALKYDLLQKEFEVYKRALKLAFENIQVDYDGYGYFVFNGKEHHYTLSEEDLMKECLKQARKELEDDK
jgi:hypothetical protein